MSLSQLPSQIVSLQPEAILKLLPDDNDSDVDDDDDDDKYLVVAVIY